MASMEVHCGSRPFGHAFFDKAGVLLYGLNGVVFGFIPAAGGYAARQFLPQGR